MTRSGPCNAICPVCREARCSRAFGHDKTHSATVEGPAGTWEWYWTSVYAEAWQREGT